VPVAPGVARAGSWTGSYEQSKGSKCANLTCTSKATNGCGEMEWQAEGLLTDIRGCITQHISPAGDEGTFLFDSAPWFVAALQFFPFILL